MSGELNGWHCSPIENETSILAEGLHPEWCRAIRQDGVRWVHEPVHVSLKWAEADFIADLHGKQEVVAFAVDLDGLTLHPGFDGPGTFAIYEWVEPWRLTKDHVYRVPDEQWARHG